MVAEETEVMYILEQQEESVVYLTCEGLIFTETMANTDW